MTNTGSPLPPSLPEYIRRLVEVDIVTGALAARTRITEEQLAKRYSVSRTPVREAMRLLENQRLLVRRKAGVFVATHTTRDEVEVIYQVRQSVESFLTEQAAGAISDEALARLQKVHDEFRRELHRKRPAPDIANLVALDSQFHWGIYETSRSELTGLVTSYWGLLQRELAQRVYEASPPATFADQHEEILDALKHGDSTAARAHMLDHLKASSDVILATFDDITDRGLPRIRNE
jgi:DNA-binding GntR family transcriptional regulator